MPFSLLCDRWKGLVGNPNCTINLDTAPRDRFMSCLTHSLVCSPVPRVRCPFVHCCTAVVGLPFRAMSLVHTGTVRNSARHFAAVVVSPHCLHRLSRDLTMKFRSWQLLRFQRSYHTRDLPSGPLLCSTFRI